MTKPTPFPKKQTIPAPAKGLSGWVEVFKAGAHTDSKGRQITFSQADVDRMIVNHQLGAAPAVIGHPKDTAPAYAQVEEYKREGDSLFAKFTKINPAFEAGVESGAYFNRSVSVHKDDKHGWRVRHIGWLGAVPPAIDGLQPVEFSADDDSCFEFSAPGYSLVWGVESIAKLLRGLREQMIAKDGIEAADAVLPQWQIDGALESATQARQEFQDAQSEGGLSSLYSQPKTGGDMSFTQEQLDAATAQATKEAESKTRADFVAQGEELVKLRGERQFERIGLQVNGWKAKGLVTPAEEAGLVEFMGSLENGSGAEFAFSASDKTEVKKTPAQFFSDFMATRKPVIKLGNSSLVDDMPLNTQSTGDLAKAANDFMAAEAKEGRNVSSAQAVQHVISLAGAAR